MLKVYGADICQDCLAMKQIFAQKNISYHYVDIISNTANMREFFAIRDHAAIYEAVRSREGGGIGIPLFAREGRLSLDINDALAWEGAKPVGEREYEAIVGRMGEYLQLKAQIEEAFEQERGHED